MQAAYRQHISTLWHDNTPGLAAKKTDRCCAEFYTLPDYAPPSVGRFRGGEGLGLGVATRQRFQQRGKQGCWIHHNTCPPVPISQSGPATPWTHIWSSGQPLMLRSPGSSCGFGVLLKNTSSWYWRWRECCTFTPPTDNSCRTETRTHNLWITRPTL